MSIQFYGKAMVGSEKQILTKISNRLIYPHSRTICQLKKRVDMIGPADPISNLHHIKYAVNENETALEKHLRNSREELQQWNQVFWTKHNLSFIQKKKEFEKAELSKKGSDDQFLSADEVSVFYKDFLDKNWNTHMNYLFEWHKKNVYVTFLHFRVKIENLFKKT